MRKQLKLFMMILMVLSLASMSYAGKPSDGQGVFIGNGFPSGPHHNLNIIAKKAGFVCPAQQFLCPDGETVVEDCASCPEAALDALTCQPVYGGVIFVPQEPGNDPINILMESGAKGPKGNPGATSLEVTDWCTDTIDGSGASFRLPANDQGYAVYARITGDPKQNPRFEFTNPSLKYVTDESGQPLILLGFVSNNTVYGSEGQALSSRYDSSRKGKKVQNATDISEFFKYSGSVCYTDPLDIETYCGGGVCTTYQFCCMDSDSDALYEYCTFMANVQAPTTTAEGTVTYGCPTTVTNWCCVDLGADLISEDQCTLLASLATCPEGSSQVEGALNMLVEATCREYQSEWVFNIADFVGFLFSINNTNAGSGSSVLQVRFYPLPLNTK